MAQSKSTTKKPAAASPTTLILQWLTYAMWGLTILALSILTFLVFFNFLNGSNSEYASLYTLAAIIVLLPISLVCDFLYQKNEPQKKHGASAAILAVHAVIFAIVGVGMLISGLFSTIGLITDTNTASESNSAIAMLISSVVVTILFGMVFVRTINPLNNTRLFPKIHALVMSAVIILFAVLAFTGPFATTMRTKTDRFIDNTLPVVWMSINQYAQENKQLPASLQDLSLSDEAAQKLVQENMVTYKKDTATKNDLRYQLCVTYKEKDSYSSYENYTDTYKDYLTTNNHPAGNVCYKLSVSKSDMNIPTMRSDELD